jgi:hypothetical protein
MTLPNPKNTGKQTMPEGKSEWQPIETAPKDGTRFLGAEYDDGWMIGPCIWCKTSHVPLYGFHFTEGDPEDLNIAHPSHWMPLPAPPKPHHFNQEGK